MIKKLTCSVVFIFLLSFYGCDSTKNSSESNEFKDLITIEQFEDIFSNLGKSLNVNGYSLKGLSEERNLTFVDKTLSFNKRNFLTLDGTESSPETQERIIFENDKLNSLMILDLVYLNRNLDNDLIYLNMLKPYDVKNKELLESFDSSIISYKNILFKLTLLDEKDINEKDLFNFDSEIQKFLKEYEK